MIEHHGAEVSVGVEELMMCWWGIILAEHRWSKPLVKTKEVPRVVSVQPWTRDAKHGPGWLFDWTTMQEPGLITGYGGLTPLTLKERRETLLANL
jgi:hypothetical protein